MFHGVGCNNLLLGTAVIFVIWARSVYKSPLALLTCSENVWEYSQWCWHYSAPHTMHDLCNLCNHGGRCGHLVVCTTKNQMQLSSPMQLSSIVHRWHRQRWVLAVCGLSSMETLLNLLLYSCHGCIGPFAPGTHIQGSNSIIPSCIQYTITGIMKTE